MSPRADREDTTTQETAVEEARATLLTALADLSAEAALVAKALRSKRLAPDVVSANIAGVTGEFRGVQRAEEALLIAMHDLAGARGEDL